MSIQLIKKKENEEAHSGLDLYSEKLRNHRLKKAAIAFGVLLCICLCAWGIYSRIQNATYTTYEILSSSERSDTIMTQYAEFLNYVLKYGKDGISCVDANNRLVWSQTYNMQNPIIYVCENSAALAEAGGTQAMIFDSAGMQGEIQTLLPIQRIAVSSQGILAVLLEDGNSTHLNLYNKKGEELVSSKFELKETGYPLAMSLSADATKLAVSFLQVQDGSVNTCLAFYNFDTVGENYEDHLVASKIAQGAVIPSVQYVDGSHCFAVGTDSLIVYEGEQIPEMKEEVPLDRKVFSVFYSDHSIGMVVEGVEEKYALQVYDVQGKLSFETEFDMEYQTLKFSGKNILIYNEFDCMMLNSSGKIFYTGSFHESISNLYALSGRDTYMVMHADRSDRIRLR